MTDNSNLSPENKTSDTKQADGDQLISNQADILPEMSEHPNKLVWIIVGTAGAIALGSSVIAAEYIRRTKNQGGEL